MPIKTITLHHCPLSRKRGRVGEGERREGKNREGGAFAVTLLILLFSLSTQATQIEETELESKTRDLSRELRCLVCQGENVWDSNSPLAGQMRDLVRERLRQGESPQQISAYLESRYGDFVLMKPPKHGLNWLLWLGPFAILLVGAFLLQQAIRRWRRPEPPAESQAGNELSDEQKRKIEAELARLEDES